MQGKESNLNSSRQQHRNRQGQIPFDQRGELTNPADHGDSTPQPHPSPEYAGGGGFDLWGEEFAGAQLQSSQRNVAIKEKITRGMGEKGTPRTRSRKIKELGLA